MKLYLSSYRVPNPEALFKLVGKDSGNISVAIIPNAKDYYSDYVKKLKNSELLADLDEIGLSNCTTIDLNDFSDNDTAELSNELKKYDLIWVNGGNTFCLRYSMRQSGFDQVIREVVESGVVYAGESAGAIVAGDTIKGAENADEPTFAPEIIFDGLNLVSDFILPHIDSPKYAEAKAEIRKIQKNHPSIIGLKDSQAYLVDSDSKSIIS